VVWLRTQRGPGQVWQIMRSRRRCRQCAPCGQSGSCWQGRLTFGAGGGLSLVVNVEADLSTSGSVGRRMGESSQWVCPGVLHRRPGSCQSHTPHRQWLAQRSHRHVLPPAQLQVAGPGHRQGGSHVFNIQDKLAGLIHAGGNLEPVKLLEALLRPCRISESTRPDEAVRSHLSNLQSPAGCVPHHRPGSC